MPYGTPRLATTPALLLTPRLLVHCLPAQPRPSLPLPAPDFFDAGSCIDGRLTSAWNWCSKLEKKVGSCRQPPGPCVMNCENLAVSLRKRPSYVEHRVTLHVAVPFAVPTWCNSTA